MLRLALVLWHGGIGGSEIFMATLASRMRELGGDATLVFVGDPQPLMERVAGDDLAYVSLGLSRGRDVVRHPRRFATLVSRVGADGALLIECGFMGAVLRAGGYAAPIVATEHGALCELPGYSRSRRYRYKLARRLGARSIDAEVGVSDFMLDRLDAYPHAKRLQRIYNGIDLPPSSLAPAETDSGFPRSEIRIGYVGRLVPGKGVDHLLAAVARVRERMPARLRIAGDGPDRSRLESLALAVGADVEWLGAIDDVPGFWRDCDIAVVPSNGVESFSMATLEAMACGKPVVASRVGAIPELVVDGTTGTLITPGDVGAVARAVIAYAERPDLRRLHGEAARARAASQFRLDDCTQSYIRLFAELAGPRSLPLVPANRPGNRALPHCWPSSRR